MNAQSDVVKTVHIGVAGYPDRDRQRGLIPALDRVPSYADLAGAIEDASIDAISLEDAHRHNDLATAEMRLERTTVIWALSQSQKARWSPSRLSVIACRRR